MSASLSTSDDDDDIHVEARPIGLQLCASVITDKPADAALEHFANISHLMEPLMATATVTGEVLGTPNDMMRGQLGDGEPKLFTPWMAASE